jgi:hypothetical protein
MPDSTDIIRDDGTPGPVAREERTNESGYGDGLNTKRP